MEVGGDRPDDDVRSSEETQLHQETDQSSETIGWDRPDINVRPREESQSPSIKEDVETKYILPRRREHQRLAGMSNLSHVTKLEGPQNYQAWATGLKGVALSNRVWKVMNGTISRPTPPPMNASDIQQEAYLARLEDWEEAEEIAQGYILQTIKQGPASHCTDSMDAPKMFETLKNMYKTKGYTERHLHWEGKKKRPMRRKVGRASKAGPFQDHAWYMSTAASYHMTFDSSLFDTMRPSNQEAELADGSLIKAKGVGTITLSILIGDELFQQPLHEVYYMPELANNLLSVGYLEKKGFSFEASNGRMQIKEGNEVRLEATRVDTLYVLNQPPNLRVMMTKKDTHDVVTWHR